MDLDEYFRFYETDYYGDDVYYHSLTHDKKVAKLRLKNYNLPETSKILDVGCGNAAFVTEAREQGLEAYGTELALDASDCPYVFQDFLENIFFPTDHFDYITMHDVLEHLPNPITTLQEIKRILKQGGEFILDFPRFWGGFGDHHWKKVEHLWMLNEDRLVDLLKKAGFDANTYSYPINSKVLIKATKPKEERMSVLVPPGIGDAYWTITKIIPWAQKEGIGIPDVYVASPKTKVKRDRCLPYIEKVPFLSAKGYKNFEVSKRNPVWDEAYMRDGRTIFHDIEGCNYFFSYNGVTRNGGYIEECDTDYETCWFFPMFESLEEQSYANLMRYQYGDYIVAYFVDHGMYRKWLKEWPVVMIQRYLRELSITTSCPILMIGASWDKDGINQEVVDGHEDIIIDLTGKTSLDMCFALLRNAMCVTGFPSGVTIKATAFGTPTYMLWNKYFNCNFWQSAVPPESRLTWYRFGDTANTGVQDALTNTMKVIQYGR